MNPDSYCEGGSLGLQGIRWGNDLPVSNLQGHLRDHQAGLVPRRVAAHRFRNLNPISMAATDEGVHNLPDSINTNHRHPARLQFLSRPPSSP